MTIAVAHPMVMGNEANYLLQCAERAQFSGGDFLQRFEQAFAEYVGVKHALAVSSGTAALHLALLALDIGPGDEVIVPDVTFVATANAVRYCEAEPIPVDVHPFVWTMVPEQVWDALSNRTRAILPVHLYGQPAALDALTEIAQMRKLALVEDAAEAIGSTWRGRLVGGLGDVGCFSFFGNKTITTGEGGMVVTNRDDVAARVYRLRGQGQGDRRYWHEEVGYNYRMSEMQAAVGLAQLENIETHLEMRRWVRRCYEEQFGEDAALLQASYPQAQTVQWMNAIMLPSAQARIGCAEHLARLGVETRPVFTPIHQLPMYRRQSASAWQSADRLWLQALVLPTHAGLTEDQIAMICREVRPWLNRPIH